jgi:SAM-dependent methyltransferase
MLELKDGSNFRVYNEPAVAAHYAALDYLTPCEQFLFETYIPRGTDVLDLGVGGGRTTPYLSAIAGRYLGLDYSEEMIRASREKFPALEFRVADAAELSWLGDASFGAIVIAFNGLDYVIPEERRKRCLRECSRILRPEGVLIFSSHNPRAVLVRPAWDRQRLRDFAARFGSGRRQWSDPLVRFLTPLKAAHSFFRAATGSAVRISKRMVTLAFWRGDGYANDPAHGGLTTHYAMPSRVTAEVSALGFQIVNCTGDDFPRSSHLLVTDWYYYVFSKGEIDAGGKSCA